MPAGVDVEPDMVAGGQRARGVVQSCRAFGERAGRDFCPERLELHLQTVSAAEVVAQHVEQDAAAPELLAVFEFVDERRPVVSVVAPQDHEQAHAEADQPPRHPVEDEERYRHDVPDAM
jgi:hypothetical protein